MFLSQISHRETVFDDNNARLLVEQTRSFGTPGKLGCGLIERPWQLRPLGSLNGAAPMSVPKIPRSDWAEIIESRERNGARLSDLFKLLRMPILNQGQRPYCWFFGTLGAYMMARGKAGLNTIHFSASSVAARIKNGRDQGGWAGEAIEGWLKFGEIYEHKDWPEDDNSLSRLRQMTEPQRRAAATHLPAEYMEIRAKDFDAVMTLLLMGIPVTLGLLWWGHLVYAIDPVVLANGRFGVRIVNSWGSGWEDGGMSILAESKATPDEAYGVRIATASNESPNTIQLATAL